MKRSARPVEVVRLPRRRVPAPPSAPLPELVQAALASIAADLRHLPRDCIGDAAELLVWLRRMAGRVDGIGRMRVPGVLPLSPRPQAPALPHPTTPSLVEVVFGAASVTSTPSTRTIVSRRGKPVCVEVRRPRAVDQFEMKL